jgi:hypothetical protein
MQKARLSARASAGLVHENRRLRRAPSRAWCATLAGGRSQKNWGKDSHWSLKIQKEKVGVPGREGVSG